MTSVITCDHCGRTIGSDLEPRVRVSVEPRGRVLLGARGSNLKDRAVKAAEEAKAMMSGRNYDLHHECYEQHVLPHLAAAGLDR